MINEWQLSNEKLIPWVLKEDTSDFQALISKFEQTGGLGGPTMNDYEHAIRQIISDAVVSDKVVIIFVNK